MTKGEAEDPECPREVTAEKDAIRLFLAYLKQEATGDAIMAIASDKGNLREFANYAHTLSRHNGRSTQSLRSLITVAPALYAVANVARELPESIIPRDAIPSFRCVSAALLVYHEWVRGHA